MTIPEFPQKVLDLADEVFTYIMDEIDDGEFRPKLREFTPAEMKGFYRSLSDAFADEIED